MRFRTIAIVLLIFLPTVLAHTADVSAAAAISLKESLETIRAQYESSSGDRIELTFASSGQLAAQIENGAPIDLFISAAKTQVDELHNAQKTEQSTAVVLVANQLVLIAPADSKSAPAGFADLKNVQKIAIGEPKSVPAGEYAQQTLEHLKLSDALKGKLIYGLNVRQVLQYVQSGEVDAGLVYLSDAKEAGDKVKIIATADADWHEPIEYWAVVISGSPHAEAAKKFLAYLQTEPAQKILEARGFSRPTTQPTTARAK